jgi:hypothetical protein
MWEMKMIKQSRKGSKKKDAAQARQKAKEMKAEELGIQGM